jgi:hypothetical protein
LIAVAKTQTLDPARSKIYFEAVAKINSDYECRRTLSAVAQQNLSNELVVDVLHSARTLQSDYERAELLVLVAGKYPLSSTARDLYLSLVGGMSSDYEKNRALSTLIKKD